MYIQITDRCNMTCEHCGFSCTDKGQDMSKEVFMKALDFDGYYTIGGGEPTIHPLFWEFIIEAIAHPNHEGLWMVTNGSITDTSLKLARLTKKGVIACELSQDSYHDPIDYEVIEAFQALDNGIRNTEMNLIGAGRAKVNELVSKSGCVCEDFIIQPDGKIRQCGCPDAPIIGDVFTEPDWNIECGYCYKESPTLD